MAEIAIECVDVWKSFRVYHERSHTIKERFLGRSNKYEEFWALKGVDFEVPAGSTLGIIGSNGSGKSTMLKVLAKILTPNQGRVTIKGSMAALLELGTGFHPDLTGRENVFLASSVLGRSEKATRRMYDEIVDFAGVEQFMDLPLKNYSTGMHARLAFAVSISVDPEVLLLDEVLSVGDEDFQMKCFERINYFRQEGRTIVLVSHSLDTIRSMCADAVWIEKGDLRAYGPSDEVVAEYLGDVHVAEGATGQRESSDRWGNGDVMIKDVAIKDATGKQTTVLRSRGPASVEIRYESSKPVDELVAGLAIYRGDNFEQVHGQNSLRSDLELKRASSGTFRLDLVDLPLLKGNYVMTVALHDRSSKLIYDWHEHAYSFSVMDDASTVGEVGLVHLGGSWSASGEGA